MCASVYCVLVRRIFYFGMVNKCHSEIYFPRLSFFLLSLVRVAEFCVTGVIFFFHFFVGLEGRGGRWMLAG